MVKIQKVMIFLSIVFCLAGCEKNEVSIFTEEQDWEYSETKIDNLPENARVCYVNGDGVFYTVEAEKEQESDERMDLQWYYRSNAGEETLLWEEVDVAAWARDYGGESLFISVNGNEKNEVIKLSSNGDAEKVFSQNASQFPYMQWAEDYIIIIQNNFSEDHSTYENELILYNLQTKESQSIYKVCENRETGIGADILCASLDNKTICFLTRECVEEYKTNNILYIYDIEKETIMKQVPLDISAYFAAYVKDTNTALLSQTDKFYISEAGTIGLLTDDGYVESAKIPLISASNMIRNSIFSENGYYMTANESAYFWNVETNQVYVCDYNWLEKEGGTIAYPTENGLACLLKKGDETYIRVYSPSGMKHK